MIFRGVLVVLLCISASSYGYSVLKLQSGMKAIVVLPESYKETRRYPVLVALHGMKENMHLSYRRFKELANQNNMILLCPEGSDYEKAYLRESPDDLAQIMAVYELVLDRYRVDRKKTVLLGFSRGGTIALETAMRYPQYFPIAVSMFGFFNTDEMTTYYRQAPLEIWEKRQVFLITGSTDYSKISMQRAYDFFTQRRISVQLWSYEGLIHDFPTDFPAQFTQMLEEMRVPKTQILALKNG